MAELGTALLESRPFDQLYMKEHNVRAACPSRDSGTFPSVPTTVQGLDYLLLLHSCD